MWVLAIAIGHGKLTVFLFPPLTQYLLTPRSDAADHHPEAKVIAFDRLDVLPEWVPPNLTCQIDNADRGRTLCQDMTERTGRALEMTETICDLLRTAGFRHTNTVSGTDTLRHEFDVKGYMLLPFHLGLGWEISKINQTAEMMKKDLPVPIERYVPSLFRRATADRQQA